MKGALQNIKDETNTNPCFKDYSDFNPYIPHPDTQFENKNYSNNQKSNSIGNKKTDDETIQNDEEFDDKNNPIILQNQNLSEITNNNNINETNQPENNEEDFINNLAIIKN